MMWKWIGVGIYMLALLAIGIAASRRMGDMRDYYAGGKKFGFLAAAFSARATGESAWLLLGLTGMGAMLGVQAFWVVVGEVLGVAGCWLLMAGRFKRLTDRYDAITIPDYLEGRFRDGSKKLRMVSAAALVIFVTIYVSAQIDATGTAFESFLGVDYMTGALVGFAVVMAYIVSGGFVAVVWSDVFQGTLMFLGLVILPIVGITMIGGVDEMMAGLAAIDPDLTRLSGPGGWSTKRVLEIIGLSLIGLGFLGSPQIFVRLLSLKSDKEIAPGAAVALVWTIVADSGAVVTGMVGRTLLAPAGFRVEMLGNGGQNVLPLLVELALPAMLVGLFIAIVLSAIMSTVDSLLIVASSAAVRDWYQQVKHPEIPDADLVGLSRKVTVALALVSLGVAFTVATLVPGRTVFWFVIFGWSGIAATFCPTIILSLFWSKFTARGAMAAMVVGFVGVPLFKFGAPALPEIGWAFSALSELPPAFLLSGLAGMVASLTDPVGQAKLSDIANELDEAAS